MNVEPMAMSQPRAKRAQMAPAATPCRSHIGVPTGCHCQNSSSRTRLVASTYVLRSTCGGIQRATQRLKPERAMTEC